MIFFCQKGILYAVSRGTLNGKCNRKLNSACFFTTLYFFQQKFNKVKLCLFLFIISYNWYDHVFLLKNNLWQTKQKPLF